MPNYIIKHITKYSYESSVVDGISQIMLYPIQDAFQQVTSHTIKINENPEIDIFTDFFGNKVGVFTILKPHNELLIVSEFVVNTIMPSFPNIEETAIQQWQHLETYKDTISYFDYLNVEGGSAFNKIAKIADSFYDINKTPLDFIECLLKYIYENFEYKKGITDTETEVIEILNLKAGVCQDFAHLMLATLRSKGIPSRYVSGYICPKNHEFRGEGATHAWVEAFLPNFGWLGIDPTNNCLVHDRHVKLAVGKSFKDCTPVKGIYKGNANHLLQVSVAINNPEKIDLVTTENSNINFAYVVKTEDQSENSYRKFMEIQQQQ